MNKEQVINEIVYSVYRQINDKCGDMSNEDVKDVELAILQALELSFYSTNYAG